jgi:hypothetical protein
MQTAGGMGATGFGLNNGGLAVASNLRHVIALLVISLLDMDADDFWDSSRLILMCGIRHHWISKPELTVRDALF